MRFGVRALQRKADARRCEFDAALTHSVYGRIREEAQSFRIVHAIDIIIIIIDVFEGSPRGVRSQKIVSAGHHRPDGGRGVLRRDRLHIALQCPHGKRRAQSRHHRW